LVIFIYFIFDWFVFQMINCIIQYR
jgi:hypothetical protein